MEEKDRIRKLAPTLVNGVNYATISIQFSILNKYQALLHLVNLISLDLSLFIFVFKRYNHHGAPHTPSGGG